MRIYGPNGTTLGSPAASARRTSTTGFALPDDAASIPESRGPSAPKAAASIDALLAINALASGRRTAKTPLASCGAAGRWLLADDGP